MPKGVGRPTNRKAKKKMKESGSLMRNIVSDAQWGKTLTRQQGLSNMFNKRGSEYLKRGGKKK